MVADNIAVVIPVRDNWTMTSKCLDSIYTRLQIPKHVVIVDDHSRELEIRNRILGDIILKYSLNRGKALFWVVQSKGEGFGPAINSGMKFIMELPGIEYIVLLNNDTVLHSSHWIDILQSEFMVCQQIGAVGLGHALPENTDRPLEILKKYSYLGFWCIMIKKEVWITVGPLDERFEYGYHEDRDWCYRMQDAGYLLAKSHRINIRHHNNSTFDILGMDKSAIGLTNHDRFIEKWGFLE